MIISDKSTRYGLTVPIMLTVMGSLIGIMSYFMDRMDRTEEIYGVDDFQRYSLPCVEANVINAVCIMFCV